MLRLDRILFPTDGSESAEAARRHASFLADRHHARLHILHVEEREADWEDVIDISEADVLANLHMDGEIADVGVPQVEEHTLAHPSAAEGILSYAAEQDIDLVVMGTNGRRGVRRLVMGSVAEEVVREAECPVLTIVARSSEEEEAVAAGVDWILVPVDFSDQTDSLLAHAREVALAYDAGIDLVHVIQPVSLPTAYGSAPIDFDPEQVQEEAHTTIENRADRLREAGVRVETETRIGHPAEEILRMAESTRPDLIAIATHGRTGVRRLLLGSVAEKVVRMAPVPVFTVKSYGRTLVAPQAVKDTEEAD